MTDQEIKERNEQIALMLGHKTTWFDRLFSTWKLWFPYDWNLLMKSVDFIEKLRYEFHGNIVCYISSNNCTLQGTKLRTDPENFHPALYMESYGNDKKEAVFIAVSDFAKMFNNKEI